MTIQSVTLALIRSFDNHQFNVNRPAWNPRGTLLAAPDDSAEIWIWDHPAGALRHRLRDSAHPAGRVYSVAWSSDGRLLAAAMDNPMVRVWDVRHGSVHSELDIGEGRVHTVAWSPNRPVLAAGTREGLVRIWNVKSNRPVSRLEGHADWVNSVAWSPDGSLLVSGGGDRDKSVRVWDVRSASQRWIGHHADFVLNVVWAPDNRFIASASNDRTIQVWEPTTGRKLFTIHEHQLKVKCLSVSSDSRLLASKSEDGTVRIFETQNWRCVSVLEEPASGRWAAGLAFHPTLPVLVTLGVKDANKDVAVRLWDVAVE